MNSPCPPWINVKRNDGAEVPRRLCGEVQRHWGLFGSQLGSFNGTTDQPTGLHSQWDREWDFVHEYYGSPGVSENGAPISSIRMDEDDGHPWEFEKPTFLRQSQVTKSIMNSQMFHPFLGHISSIVRGSGVPTQGLRHPPSLSPVSSCCDVHPFSSFTWGFPKIVVLLHHPFLDGIFHEINQVPPFMQTPR